MGRILAIDYGAKRTGLAVTDPLKIIASGLTTVETPKIISFLKEYAVALFLFSEGSRVIGTTMIELWKQGGAEPVAALSTIQMVITAFLIFGSTKLLGVKLHE